MPVDHAGRYAANPQLGRAMEKARGGLKDALHVSPKLTAPDEPQNAVVHIHHIEYHPHPDGGGRLMSQIHHHDGNVDEEEHEDAEMAAEHLREHGRELGDGQDQGDEEDLDEPESHDDDGGEGHDVY